jgi:hypothetical protein
MQADRQSEAFASFEPYFIDIQDRSSYTPYHQKQCLIKRYERDTMMATEVTVVECLAAGTTPSARRSNWGSL